MKPPFCAIANQETGEDLIGTAGHYQAYVLIECPEPWPAKVFSLETAFSSQHLPPALCQYIKALRQERSVQVLAVNRNSAPREPLTLMVYESKMPSDYASGIAASTDKSIEGYRGYEYKLSDLTQVVDCLEAHWQGGRIGQPIVQRDILVCTHGMRDRCCARFGRPLFRDAARSAERDKLPNTRVWKVSHIGGHRFAPTAISFPDGRYYGRLSLSALQQIVMRSGSISQLRSVYRGWGLLPKPLQVLERQLMLKHGWSWFEQKLSYRIFSDEKNSHPDKSLTEKLHELSVEIWVEPQTDDQIDKQPDQRSESVGTQPLTYRAKLIYDPQKAVHVKASCSSTTTTRVVKYTIAECALVKRPQPVPEAVNA